MTKIEFTSNYNDLSTDQGFQFEFNCNRCSTGYRTSFKPYTIGKISGALDTASSLFGGIFSHASTIGDRARTATGKRITTRRSSKLWRRLREILSSARVAPLGMPGKMLEHE